MLVLARGASRDYVTMGSFLLDTYCLGINGVMFEAVGGEAFEDYIEAINADAVSRSRPEGGVPCRGFPGCRRAVKPMTPSIHPRLDCNP